MTPALPLAAAYLIDLLLGDPRWLPHPVVGMGRLIAVLEGRLRRLCRTARAERAAGVVLAVLVTGVVWSLAWLAVAGAGAVSPWLKAAVEAALIWTALAQRSLAGEALAVAAPLTAGDLLAARQCLSRIVGRQTDHLPAEEVARAAVETVAENTSDGVVAPLFYALLGGAPLALAYKAVNTMDSMIGYRHPPYTHLGWAAARLDDLANLLPARLTAALMVAAAALLGQRAGMAAACALRQGRCHPSPNAGYPEAACAGALAVRLGGENRYQGRRSRRPHLGPAGAPLPGVADIGRAVRLMRWTCHLALLLAVAAAGVAGGSGMLLAVRGG